MIIDFILSICITKPLAAGAGVVAVFLVVFGNVAAAVGAECGVIGDGFAALRAGHRGSYQLRAAGGAEFAAVRDGFLALWAV